MNLSDFILSITAIFIGWQSWETRRLVKLTKIKDQPLIEVEFQNQGAEITLKNIGQSPAYSPSISSIEITINEHLDFDPLHSSRLPILINESRKVWMHHQRVNEKSIGGFVESAPVLKNFVISKNTPTKIILQYFDKDGVKLRRNLYIKVSGNKISGDQKIYTTTTCE